MKIKLLLLAVMAFCCAWNNSCRADGEIPSPFAVVVEGVTNSYDFSAAESAKEYVDAYAANVQNDKAFKTHQAAALSVIRKENRFFGSWLSILPPLIAILLALITKEVYSSLFVGIVAGGLLYSGFSFEGSIVSRAARFARFDDEQDGWLRGVCALGLYAYQKQSRRPGLHRHSRHSDFHRRLFQLPDCGLRNEAGD